MKNFYLIEAATMLAIHFSENSPEITETSVVFDNETFLCFNENNSFILEAEEVADFAQFKYRAVGNNLVLNLDWVDPTPPVDLNARRAEIWEEIKQYRDDRILNGGYPAGAHWYHSDLIMRSQLLANARKADKIEASGGDMTTPMTNIEGEVIQVKTMDNGYISITAQMAIDIMNAIEVHEMATYKTAATHKYFLDQAADPDTYDWKTGWPLIFGET